MSTSTNKSVVTKTKSLRQETMLLTSKGGSRSVTLATLACLWFILFCLATAWVVLFVSSRMTDHLSAKRCATDWEFYNGSCYYFSQDKLTWEQSQYACIQDGGHLVIIESQPEQDFIRKKVGNNDVKNTYWIGMTDIKEEGTWVWMDNTTLNYNIKYWDLRNGTENSDKPEPNNYKLQEHCARMGRTCLDKIQCWFDYRCDIPSKVICESRAAK